MGCRDYLGQPESLPYRKKLDVYFPCSQLGRIIGAVELELCLVTDAKDVSNDVAKIGAVSDFGVIRTSN